MKTSQSLPPQIIQHFSSILLSTPCVKFNDDEKTLWKIWQYVEKKLWKKLESTPAEKIKCERFKEEFLKIYDTITKKKENEETKDGNVAEEAFYRIRCASRSNEKLLSRLRYKT